MEFHHNERVEICKKDEGLLGSYYPAIILAAIGRSRYIVQYKTRFSDDKTRFLSEAVDETDIRPSPPEVKFISFKESDKVDAFVNGAWWMGRVARIVDPNYYVKLESSGNEVHCPFYKVRIHLQWKNGKWVIPAENRPKNDGVEGNESKQKS